MIRIVADRLEVDVRGLEVAVDDAERVGLGERRADLPRDLGHQAPRDRPARPVALEQRHAPEQLHDDVEDPLVLCLAELVGRDGVRAAQGDHRGALTPEPGDHPAIGREPLVEDLERDLVAGPDVGRAVDRAEPAGGDPRVDPVAAIEQRPEQGIDAFDQRPVVRIECHAGVPLYGPAPPRGKKPLRKLAAVSARFRTTQQGKCRT